MARCDPDKRWLAAVDTIALMKRAGWRPLFVARGGAEPHGAEVLDAMRARGLVRVERRWREPGARGLLAALRDTGDADVVDLRSHVDAGARRLLFRGADAVLANSRHEPFGLVGLETMAAGGLACTGATGEDYAVPGQNALVLETERSRRVRPAVRAAARATAGGARDPAGRPHHGAPLRVVGGGRTGAAARASSWRSAPRIAAPSAPPRAGARCRRATQPRAARSPPPPG